MKTTTYPTSLSASFLQATRPRTFPLAMASIITGNALAYQTLLSSGGFSNQNWGICIASVWVALCLQILSNLANDYGDGVKGTDDLRDEDSPDRMTVAGHIDADKFKRMIFVWAGFTFACGVGLIYWGFDNLSDFLLFLAFGVLAILAACAYTMGKRPYGYRAMGEVAVLLFFGWLGVLGSCYLHTDTLTMSITADMWLIATGCGLFSACVLYVNNMRDVISDKQANKTTIAVLLKEKVRKRIGKRVRERATAIAGMTKDIEDIKVDGFKQMVIGYIALLLSAIFCYLLYALVTQNHFSLLWLITLPLIIKHLRFVYQYQKQPKQLGTQLKVIVLINLLVSIGFSLGVVIQTVMG